MPTYLLKKTMNNIIQEIDNSSNIKKVVEYAEQVRRENNCP